MTNIRSWLRATACTLMGSALLQTSMPADAQTARTPPAAESPVREAVATENLTGFKDLGKHLAEVLPPELQRELKRRNLAVFALTATFEDARACYAMVGLTGVAAADRHPRVPSQWFSGFQTMPKSAWNADECRIDRLTEVIVELARQKPESLLAPARLTETQGEGGMRPARSADSGKADLWHFGGLDTGPLFERIHARDFGKAFDYRHTSAFLFSDSTRFDSGDIMCVVFAGITARPPQDRKPRWPGTHWQRVRVQKGGTPDGCRQFVAEQLLDHVLDLPPGADGLLRDAAAAREDGVPLPDPARVGRAAGARAHARSDPPARNVREVRCSNKCINGDCLRTFDNGRQERWQAPWRFDPVTRNWTWDITTNACGA